MAYENVIFRTTDGTKWGTGKGSNLTASEIDLNFWECIRRIKALEDDPPVANGIANIQVIGSQMQITMDDASTFGPFTLPTARWVYRGEYTPGVPYHELDLITAPGKGLYMLAQDYTPAVDEEFDPNKLDPDNSDIVYVLVFPTNFVYDFGFFFPGQVGYGLLADDVMASHLFAHPVMLPKDLPGSKARLSVAPADGDLVFNLKINESTDVGTLTFPSGEVDGVFATDDLFTIPAGATFDVMMIDPIDSEARSLRITIAATRIGEEEDAS